MPSAIGETFRRACLGGVNDEVSSLRTSRESVRFTQQGTFPNGKN